MNILNMLYILPFYFLSSRCRLFRNATFFGSCNIHLLNNTGVLKFKRKFRRQRLNGMALPGLARISRRKHVLVLLFSPAIPQTGM
jgi:hypothetical protein